MRTYRLATVLVGASMLAAPVLALAAQAPAIHSTVAVRASPVNPVPDAGESDEQGLEQREAMGAAPPPASSAASEVAQVMAGSLNAQLAALQPAASPLPAPSVLPTAPAGAPLAAPAVLASLAGPASATPAVARLLPAVASAPAPAMATPDRMGADAPGGPSVALAARVVESAEAFADYMGRAAALKADYTDGPGVAKALASGGVYEAGQIDEGLIAYVALVALQDGDFVRAMDEAGREADHTLLAQALTGDPRAIMRLPSSAGAAARAARALGRMGSALQLSGAAVKQSAYTIQTAAWSRAAPLSPAAMLAELKTRSAVREALAPDSSQAMLATLAGLRTLQPEGGSGRLTPVVARGLTLAALAVIGEAGEDHAERVATLMSDADSGQCLKMARLNLYQCLSVAGPNYEDVFCLGQHAMLDTARCVADASGWAAPAAAGIAVPVARAEAPRSVMVPVALGLPSASASPAAVAAPAPAATSLDVAESPPGEPGDATPAGAPPPMQLAGQLAGAGQP